MKNIIFFCLLLGFPVMLLAQYQLCSTPTSKTLYDLHFVDAAHGLAVGDSGTIIRTADGGSSWHIAHQNDSISLTKVRYFDQQHAIAMGTDLLHSSDSGRTWQLGSLSNQIFYDIAVVNDSVAYLCGYPLGFMKTSNRGNDWDTLVPMNPNQAIGLLSFVRDEVGLSMPLGGRITNSLFKTRNGGHNWDTLPVQSGFDNTVLEALAFQTEEKGFRAGWYNGHLMLTADSGQNWQGVHHAGTGALFFEQLIDMHINQNPSQVHYACGWYGKIFKSVDGGYHWQEQASLVPNNLSLYGIFFLNDSLGWVVGARGTVLKTANGGGTVGLASAYLPMNLRLYPNPAQTHLYAETGTDIRILRLTVFDKGGKELLSQKKGFPIDISPLPAGSYFIRIFTHSGPHGATFIKN